MQKILNGLTKCDLPARQLLSKSLNVLVLLLLIGSVVACGGFAPIVGVPETTAKLKYQNPQKPSPVLPLNPTLTTMTELLVGVKKGTIRSEGYVCMTHNDSLDLASWMKDVGRWERSAITIIDFHEEQNQ